MASRRRRKSIGVVEMTQDLDGALAGLRVIDAATLAAGPLIATWMGEQGAEVIKVEQDRKSVV